MNRIREAPRPVENPAVSADVNAAASILSRVIGPPLPKQTLDQIAPPLTGQIPSGHDCTRCAAVSSCSLLNMAAENDGDNPIMRRMKAINLLKLENPDFMNNKSDKEREAVIREKMSSFGRVTVRQEAEPEPEKPKAGKEQSPIKKKRQKRRSSWDESGIVKSVSDEQKTEAKIPEEKIEAPAVEVLRAEKPAAVLTRKEIPLDSPEPSHAKNQKITKPIPDFPPVIRPAIHVNPFARPKSVESFRSESIDRPKKKSGEVFRFRPPERAQDIEPRQIRRRPARQTENATPAVKGKLKEIIHNAVNIFKFKENKKIDNRSPIESARAATGYRPEKRVPVTNSIFLMDKAKFLSFFRIPSKGEVPPKPFIRSEKNIKGPLHISSEKMSRFVPQTEITAEKRKSVPESRKSTNNPDIAVVLISIESEVPEESSARVPLDKEEMFVLLQNFSEVSQILEKLSVLPGTEHRPARTARSDREEEIREESPEEYYISPTQKGKNFSLVLWYIVQVMNCLNITDIIFT